MKPERRYRLRAYICGNNCFRECQDIGLTTFQDVFARRPEECRYAVLEVGSEVWVADLYEAKLCSFLVEIGDYRTYPHIDAAIMATMLTY